MFIRKISEIVGTERDVEFEHKGFKSQRLLLEKDGMGFSFHKTILPKGLKQIWHYKKHLEACYCIEGEAFITNLETGEKFHILPETIYVLNNHEQHQFEAIKDTILISVFNPPVKGNEQHNNEGSYE